jgi:hypothetical protein
VTRIRHYTWVAWELGTRGLVFVHLFYTKNWATRYPLQHQTKSCKFKKIVCFISFFSKLQPIKVESKGEELALAQAFE